MDTISEIMQKLDERVMAREIGNAFDDARSNYRLTSNRVSSEAEYYGILKDFYNYMATNCMTSGGSLSSFDAETQAINIIEQLYKRNGGNITTAYHDAVDGLSGGLRSQLDNITDTLRDQAYRSYMENVLRTYIGNTDFERKVEVTRQLLTRYKDTLPQDVDPSRPERYANSIHDLVNALIYSLRNTASKFRQF